MQEKDIRIHPDAVDTGRRQRPGGHLADLLKRLPDGEEEIRRYGT